MRKLKERLGQHGCPVVASFVDGEYLGSDYGVAWVEDGILNFFGDRTEFRMSVEDLAFTEDADFMFINTDLVVGSVNLRLSDTFKVTLLPLTLHPAKQAVPEAEILYEDVRSWFRTKQAVAGHRRLLPPTNKNQEWVKDNFGILKYFA